MNDFLKNNKIHIICSLLIVVLSVIILKPIVIDGKAPKGVDVLGSMYQSKQMIEHQKATGNDALWNPYLFGGMPIYFMMEPKSPAPDNVLKTFAELFVDNVFNWHVVGGLGMYFFLIYMGFLPMEALFAAFCFLLLPHYKALWVEGHNMKLRALFALPWVLLALQYFLNRRNLLGAALFALAWGVQIRTQHYQIIFYTGLFILSVSVYPLIKDVLLKEFSRFGKSAAFLLFGAILAVLLAAQPLFLANEYLPYSKRGKSTVDLKETAAELSQKQKKTDGVRIDYATDWSTAPGELTTWLVPRYYGGMSAEKYDGAEFRQLKGKQVPGYWGDMPFTQSYEYFGVIILLLAAIGAYHYRKDAFIISLLVFSLFLILLSFGKHFMSFYEFFFNNVPYFNKFRAPMMSVTVNYVIFLILAAYGFKALREESSKLPKGFKTHLYMIGGFIGLGLFMYFSAGSEAFTRTGENYNAQMAEMMQKIRAEFLYADLQRYFILLFLAAALILTWLKTKWNPQYLALAMLAVASFDLYSIRERKEAEYMDIKKLEKQVSAPTKTDQFLMADQETFRVFPVGEDFRDNRWAAFHQTIGGYSPSKIVAIEELIQNSLYSGWEPQFPINWNVMQMLNVKYLILKQPFQHPDLQLVNVDNESGYYTFLYRNYLKRGFFAASTKVIEDEYERLRYINSPEFSPANEVILHEPNSLKASIPDQQSVEVTAFSPEGTSFKVSNNSEGLFVISETYYPPGWKLYVNGEEREVIPVNHANFAVLLPAGNNEVNLVFHPDNHFKWMRVSYGAAILLYLIIAYALYDRYIKSKQASKAVE